MNRHPGSTSSIRCWDWALACQFAAFVLAMTCSIGLVLGDVLWSHFIGGLRPAAHRDYEDALREAAVHRPGRDISLSSIPVPSEKPVELVRFAFGAPKLKDGVLKEDVWVALKSDVQAACRGAAGDVNRRLQQVLGLAPVAARRGIHEISLIPTAGSIIRPCMSSLDPSQPKCSLDMPPRPDLGKAGLSDQEKLTALGAAYDHLYIVAGQMWRAHRTAFVEPRANLDLGDYPFTGAPFTAMGWTYNWNRASATHIGVAEFILRAGTKIDVKPVQQAEKFCASSP